MKLSDYVIDVIVKEGVSHIFEFIGGAITHLIDSTVGRDDVQCVSVHHEQSGAFAAEAYARINGKLGVAMATSGPGALNMLTGIGSCYFDSVPCLFITGQVNTYEYKFDKPIRQIGFQETDIVTVARPLTKYAELVADPESIRYCLEKALFLARHGRPGPVLLDLPMNVQRAQIEPDTLPAFLGSSEHVALLAEVSSVEGTVIDNVSSLIAKAARPVILVGGGVRISGATEELRKFIDLTGVPVVSSLMGLDAIPHDHPAFLGLIGSYGNRYSNLALANCDLLLILGARLDTRQTGTRPETFARGATKVHVDIDPVELNAKVRVDLALHADIRDFLHHLNGRLVESCLPDLAPWYGVLKRYREKYPTRFATDSHAIDPNSFLELLSSCCAEGDIIALDVGQNQMWAAQSFRVKQGQRLLTSGGMGAMGFALPAALGAAIASGERAIVIAGDGGIQVNIQDLDTIVRHRLPIKILVLNNSSLGMVRQFQEMYFGGRVQSTVIGYGCPNLIKIAEAYGLPAFIIDSPELAGSILDEALLLSGPAFLEVKLAQNTCLNPKLVVNRPIEDMSPHLDREELADLMLINPIDEGLVPD